MRARRQLWHDPAKHAMHILRENHERVELHGVASAGEHGRRRLVARRLDSENRRHRTLTVCSMVRTDDTPFTARRGPVTVTLSGTRVVRRRICGAPESTTTRTALVTGTRRDVVTSNTNTRLLGCTSRTIASMSGGMY